MIASEIVSRADTATAPLYVAAREAALGPPDAVRPLHWNDLDEFIQPKVEGVLSDGSRRGLMFDAISPLLADLYGFVQHGQKGTKA